MPPFNYPYHEEASQFTRSAGHAVFEIQDLTYFSHLPLTSPPSHPYSCQWHTMKYDLGDLTDYVKIVCEEGKTCRFSMSASLG